MRGSNSGGKVQKLRTEGTQTKGWGHFGKLSKGVSLERVRGPDNGASAGADWSWSTLCPDS